MLAVVPDRGRWLRDHPLEVAIVVLTPPFLPASLQAARAFRLLRLTMARTEAEREALNALVEGRPLVADDALEDRSGQRAAG